MRVLIDADSLIYSSSYKRSPDEAVANVNDKIDKITAATGADEYALFLSLGGSFRNQQKSYKSNRPKVRKEPVFYYIREYLITTKNAIFQTGLEADDLLIYWEDRLKDTIVASSDKDLTNILKKSYNYTKNVVIERSELEMELLFWKQMLTGDSADGILGVPGIGEVTADKLLDISDERLPLREQIFSIYMKHFDEYEAIHQFHQNYRLLKMLKEDYQLKLNGIDITPTAPQFMKARNEF